MASPFLFAPLEGFAPFEELVREVKGNKVISVYGLSEGQKAHIAAALSERMGRQVLLVSASDQTVARYVEDITQMTGAAALFPTREITFYHAVASSQELTNRRIETLRRVLTGEARVVVASMEALMHRLMPREIFAINTLTLREGDRIDLQELAGRLVQSGYTREEMVEGKGQFALRGGILDIFTPDALTGVRMEFFDDEVDSLRTFDTISQRSQERIKAVTIPPASEALIDPVYAKDAAQALRAELKAALKAHKAQTQEKSTTLEDLPYEENALNREIIERLARPGTVQERLEEMVNGVADALESLQNVRGLERFMPVLYGQTETIVDYMREPILLLDEPDALRGRCDNRLLEFTESYKSALERGEALHLQATLLTDYETLLQTLLREHSTVTLSTMLRAMGGIRPKALLEISGLPVSGYQGQIKELEADLGAWQDGKWRIALLSGGVSRGQRLLETLTQAGIHARFDEHMQTSIAPGEIVIYPMTLSHGFQYRDLKFIVVSDADIYGVTHKKRRTQKKTGEKIAAFTDLKVGDYIVHESHGIGIYKGTIRLASEGTYRDYLFIQYQGNDKLYVPTDQLDRIQKYIGSDKAAPRINRLGGTEWKRQKEKVKQSIKRLAMDLVQLYAQRQAQKGFAFSKDTAWQRQFEDNFPYEETADQLAAIEDIKRDMEREQPMDRLLCGDVGYGKTEVALRAAFKAIMDGKQVALLAPTTILVQQHYNTVMTRFEGFPIRAAFISRFKTAKEQKEILQKVKTGEIDLLVGTHRLLGKDIQFRDLGLLIVDEEQRFGVGHKESIKELKKTVDVLTMSATPIPRTLHMSMVGIRDMSLLETPPEERYPVQTYVVEYQDGLIRDAILREIQRGGQVYFLYNRVDSIERCHQQLSKLVPEARIAIGHGQMREHALEDVMMDFYEHKYDVLLCTTIIESGLDIPLANTLIVYDADRFGLSQLYQLRGRVGRSNRLAYAYLTVRQGKILTEVAQKRLDAIREFTQFGSGFRIAMRDLELRGAGDILGPEQSGHLTTIGYDMYCKLIEETVRETREEMGEAPLQLETRIELHVDAYLPADYVAGDHQRMEIYKRIAAIENSDDRDDVEEELIDRFGDEPRSVINLVAIAHLKAMCEVLGIDLVTHHAGQLRLRFSPYAKPNGPLLLAAVAAADKRLMFSAQQPPSILLRDGRLNVEEALHDGVTAMEKVVKFIKQYGDEKEEAKMNG